MRGARAVAVRKLGEWFMMVNTWIKFVVFLSLVAGCAKAESVNKECLDVLEESYGISMLSGVADADDVKLCKVFYNVKSMLRKYFKVKRDTISAETAVLSLSSLSIDTSLTTLSEEDFYLTSDEDLNEEETTCRAPSNYGVQTRSMKSRPNLNLSSTFSSILGSFQSLLSKSSDKLQTVHREAIKKIKNKKEEEENQVQEQISDKKRARLERQRKREAKQRRNDEVQKFQKTSTWNILNWSECSAPCGGGVKTRVVVCSGTNCSDPKPTTQEVCNTNLCARNEHAKQPPLTFSKSPSTKSTASQPAKQNEWSCPANIENGFVERRKGGRVLRFECANGYSMKHPAGSIRPVRFRFCKCANGLRISDPNQCSKHVLNDILLPYCEKN